MDDNKGHKQIYLGHSCLLALRVRLLRGSSNSDDWSNWDVIALEFPYLTIQVNVEMNT